MRWVFFRALALANSYGYMFSRKFITTSEVKQNCMRTTLCGTQAQAVEVRKHDVLRVHNTGCAEGRCLKGCRKLTELVEKQRRAAKNCFKNINILIS